MGIEVQLLFADKLKAFKRALEYMDGPAPLEDKCKWQQRFCDMLAELNDLEYRLRQSGIEIPDEEIHQLIENL